VVRSLGRRRIPTTVLDSARDAITYHSRYVRVHRLDDEDDDEAAVEQIIRAAQELPAPPVLVPTGDDSLLLVSRNAERLRQYTRFHLAPSEAIETVVSKLKFHEFAASHNLPVPNGWAPRSYDELLSCVDDMRFPVVLKPERSIEWQRGGLVSIGGSKKILRADTRDELLRYWTEYYRVSGAPLIQEYIRGEDRSHYSYVCYVNPRGEEVAAICAQKLRLTPIHGGVAAFAQLVDDEEIATKARGTVQELGFTGAVSVCFKRDEVTSEAVIHEVNGRLPLCHVMFQACGVDVPYLMYREAQGSTSDPLQPKRSKCRWAAVSVDLWSFRQSSKCGEVGFWEWVRSYRGVDVVLEFDPRDLGPFAYVLRQLAGFAIAGIRARINRLLGRFRSNRETVNNRS
jgi:predicted ATP-grasp superfamily ATP-dependent carboligase